MLIYVNVCQCMLIYVNVNVNVFCQIAVMLMLSKCHVNVNVLMYVSVGYVHVMPGHGVNGHAGERSSRGVGADGPGWHGSIRGAQHLKWEIYGKPMG